VRVHDPSAEYFDDENLANPELPPGGARYGWVVEQLSPLAAAA